MVTLFFALFLLVSASLALPAPTRRFVPRDNAALSQDQNATGSIGEQATVGGTTSLGDISDLWVLHLRAGTDS